jgi:type III secretion system YscQ/HrcQ family protein
MMVSAFDLTACPAISRADATATRALARFVARLPVAWTVDLPLLGKATLAPASVAFTVPPDAIALVVRRDGLSGRLLVPAPLASRWVDVALCGAEGFGPARVLGRAERGVLIALLAPLLDAAGWSLGLGLAPEMQGPAIALALSGAAGGGTIWLQVAPPPGPMAGSATISAERTGGVRLEASLRVASTTLTSGELAGLAVDDAVVFDGVAGAALQAEDSWIVGLWLGEFCATLRVTPDGRATISNGWRRAARMQDAKDVTMDADDTLKTAEKTVESLDSTMVLADAPIEVVAELGRIMLRADEVAGLSPGVVLGLRLERTTAVTLRVAGQPWAEGELVNIDGEVGVRVTRRTRG